MLLRFTILGHEIAALEFHPHFEYDYPAMSHEGEHIVFTPDE